MEYFPKSKLGDNWFEVFGNSIQQALKLIKYESRPSEHVRQSDDGELFVQYYNAEKLSRLLNMSKTKVERLLQWAFIQNQDLYPYVMEDEAEGYLVSSFFFNQFTKAGLRFDKFLKKIVSGEIKVGIN